MGLGDIENNIICEPGSIYYDNVTGTIVASLVADG